MTRLRWLEDMAAISLRALMFKCALWAERNREALRLLCTITPPSCAMDA